MATINQPAVIHAPVMHFEEVGITPEQILAIRFTEAENLRFESLIAKEKIEDLTEQETDELDWYMSFYRVMSSARVRALELIDARGQ